MMIIDNFKFGDIVSAEIPFTDGQSTKIRPVLILKKEGDDYLVLRISSVTNSKGVLDIELCMNNQNNLKSVSIIKITKIGLFHKFILRKKIGEISVQEKKEVKENMKMYVESF